MWWEVDLEDVYKIEYIEIYGRTDCCSERLAGAKVQSAILSGLSLIRQPAVLQPPNSSFSMSADPPYF